MANTGYSWDDAWTSVDAAIVLTQGGTTEDFSAVLNLHGKAACLISIDADYSDHDKVTAGLFVYLVRERGFGTYEVEDDKPWGFEMPFTRNYERARVFFLDAAQWNKFKIFLDWDNTTAGAIVTVQTDIKYATVPVAS